MTLLEAGCRVKHRESCNQGEAKEGQTCYQEHRRKPGGYSLHEGYTILNMPKSVVHHRKSVLAVARLKKSRVNR